METRSPSLMSRVAQWVGVGARIPKPSGPLPIRSKHFRIPGEDGVLVQCFFPAFAPPTSSSTVSEPQQPPPPPTRAHWTRTYRNGVIKGASEFGQTSHALLKMVLEASLHPLWEVNHLPLLLDGSAKQYPVVIFSHGLGGSAETYTKQCSDLASSGYVVIALEHEDGSGAHAKTAQGVLVPYKRPPPDLQYVRDQVVAFRAPFLEKRAREIEAVLAYIKVSDADFSRVMDRKRICLAGHSFGSATCAYVARRVPRETFCGILLLDVWAFPLPEDDDNSADSLPRFCSILSEVFAKNGERETTAALLRKCRASSFYVPGTVHSSFSDTPWWLPAWLSRRMQLMGAKDRDLIQCLILNIETEFLKRCCCGDSGGKEEEGRDFNAELTRDLVREGEIEVFTY